MAAVELGSTSLGADASLEGYYKLENVNDSSGNSRTLTNNGSVAFSSFKFNNGADFTDNNATKWLSRAESFGIDNTSSGSHSMSGWINLYSGFGTEKVAHTIINSKRDVAFDILNTGYLRIQVFDGTSTQNIVDDTTQLTAGTDYHVGYKMVGNNGTIYVNGSPVFTGSVTNNGTTSASTAFALGRHASVSTAYLEAKMDDWGIFSRELTDDEFSLIYNGPVSGSSMFLMM